eukprot:Clim_evm70s172 gene=Clim_evmTU70s172
MIIYKDVFSGDELFSDSYPNELEDDMIYKVTGRNISVKGGIDESLIGGNASAEGGDEGAEDGTETGIDIVMAFRLQSTQFDKKSYMVYIKDFMKRVKTRLEESNPERAKIFQEKAPNVVKKILGDFKNFDFYIGETMDPDASVVLMNYKEDGMTPYFIFFKDALVEEKV